MQMSLAWALGDNVCLAACSAQAVPGLPSPAMSVLSTGWTPAGTGTGGSPTPLGDTRDAQPHSLPWEEGSWGKDPVIRHLHALAQEPVGVVRLPCEQGLVVARTSAQHRDVGTLAPALRDVPSLAGTWWMLLTRRR